ncbi:MAG: ankyrin repeat domain-containing protein [Gemmatimonadetes bacterium]|nr:ankyrin repeat domain-containing protein [Gemmatimonadota bacterium]
MELLLTHGTDPNQRGLNDFTPLHYAAHRNDRASVELLLARGADPSLRTRIDDRETAAEAARAQGYGDLADFLETRPAPGV